MTYDGMSETSAFDPRNALATDFESMQLGVHQSDSRRVGPFPVPSSVGRATEASTSVARQMLGGAPPLPPPTSHQMLHPSVMIGGTEPSYGVSMVMPAPRQLPPFVPNAQRRANKGARTLGTDKSSGNSPSATRKNSAKLRGFSTQKAKESERIQKEIPDISDEATHEGGDHGLDKEDGDALATGSTSMDTHTLDQGDESREPETRGKRQVLSNEKGSKVDNRSYESISQTDKEKDPSTISCAFFLRTGSCAYGSRCKFHHPLELAPHVEFNRLGLPLRPGEPDCQYYLKTLQCAFGHTCKYNHPHPLENRGSGAQSIQTNQFALSTSPSMPGPNAAPLTAYGNPLAPTYIHSPQVVYPYTYNPIHPQNIAAMAAAAAVRPRMAQNAGNIGAVSSNNRDPYMSNQFFSFHAGGMGDVYSSQQRLQRRSAGSNRSK